jgi:heme O synthase-like polyprenyltransferase
LLRGASRLYRFSITYLTVIFAAIAIDAMLPR